MSKQKTRHGCLTVLLILLVAVNAIAASGYLFKGDVLLQAMPNLPTWVLPVMASVSILNIICTLALFHWKIWGFWAFAASNLISFIINTSVGISLTESSLALLGIIILYATLQIGQNKRGWPQLD